MSNSQQVFLFYTISLPPIRAFTNMILKIVTKKKEKDSELVKFICIYRSCLHDVYLFLSSLCMQSLLSHQAIRQ